MQSSTEILSGKSLEHLASEGEFSQLLHAQVVEAFCDLRDAAQAEGFDLCIASAFRSFDRQLVIWNAKVRGERPILNDRGEELDISTLSELELVHAILRWSALPGASRHHWGTDMDVYDAACIKDGSGPALVVAEYEEAGPFAGLNSWMEQSLSRFGFFRPYQEDRGGIAPEPWHISYQSVAREFESQINPEHIAGVLAGVELELGQTILEHLDEIFERHIQIT